MIKYNEKYRSVTNGIIEACTKHGLPEPLFEYAVEDFVVTFRKCNVFIKGQSGYK